MLTGVIITFLASGAIIPYAGIQCGQVGGAFIEGTNIVYVCDMNDGKKDFYLEHELGHFFWDTLTDKEKKEYTLAYEKALIRGSRNFLRKYSKASVKEDFADNYAIRKTNKNPLLKKRINLIKKYENNR